MCGVTGMTPMQGMKGIVAFPNETPGNSANLVTSILRNITKLMLKSVTDGSRKVRS